MKIFKNRTISDSGLVCCMEDLKDALQGIERSKIIFMNLESFYTYISEYENKNPEKGKNVEDLMGIIEPYIPLVITGKNIEAFLDAAISDNEQSMVQMEDAFVQNSKIKFIQSIMNAQTAEQWQEIVGICRAIRAYKEEGIEINGMY